MRKQTWIRFGLASVIMAGGTSAIVVGCGGDDTAVTPPADGGKDSAFPDTGSPDSPTTDGGGTDGDAAPQKPHAKIIIVHASPNAPDLRFCFGIGSKADGSDLAVSPSSPLPNDDSNLPTGKTYPGLYVGSGGALPDTIDLEPKAITGFAITVPNDKIKNDVKSNPNGRLCNELIGATGTGGTGATTLTTAEFLKIPTIPAGTFVKGNTYLLALTGCIPGSGTAAQCGAGFNATTGNLGIKIVQLDKTVADAAKLGLQVVHAAPAVDGVIGATIAPGGGTNLKNTFGITLDNLDGGNPPNPPAASGVNYGYGLDGGAAVPQVYSAADYVHAVAYDSITATFPTPPADAGLEGGTAVAPVKTIAIPFGAVQTLSYGTFDGGIGIGPAGTPLYVPGANYTLILVGDPSAQQLVVDGGRNPNYDGHGVHFLMFPNDPPLPKL